MITEKEVYMSEVLSAAPEEIQLQIADNEGMLDVKLNKVFAEKESVMYDEIDYRLVEQQTASWEGMLNLNE